MRTALKKSFDWWKGMIVNLGFLNFGWVGLRLFEPAARREVEGGRWEGAGGGEFKFRLRIEAA